MCVKKYKSMDNYINVETAGKSHQITDIISSEMVIIFSKKLQTTCHGFSYVKVISSIRWFFI